MEFMVIVLSLVGTVLCVLEQKVNANGKAVWVQGHYRNRNVVPRPELFLEKKHKKRDLSAVVNDEEQDDGKSIKKSTILRKHFSLPIGAMLPISFSGVANEKGTKKSQVPRVSFAKQLSNDPADHYELIDLKEVKSNVPEALLHSTTMRSKKPHDENGYERSLGGRHSENTGSYKITDEDIDGLMGRGLSGNRGRERNEILYPTNLPEEVEDLVEKQRERRYLYFPYHTYHYHHHHHHHHHHPHPPPPPHYHPYPPPYPPQHIHIHLPPTQPPPAPELTEAPAPGTTAPPSPPVTTALPPAPTTVAPLPATTAPPAPGTAAPPPGTAPPAKFHRKRHNLRHHVKRSTNQTEGIETFQPINKTDPASGVIKHQVKNDTGITIKKAPLSPNDSHETGDSRLFGWKGIFDLKQNGSVKNEHNNNGGHEMLINYGDPPDNEFDQDHPFQPNGEPYQYQNHDMHHNVQDQHPHAPYYLHKPHDDYKNVHPGHPNEGAMQSTVKDLDVDYKIQGSLNLTNIRRNSQRSHIPTRPGNFFKNMRNSIKRFMASYGRLQEWKKKQK